MTRLVEVGPESGFPPGSMRAFVHEGKRYLVVRLDDGFHALDAICSHEYAELDQGFLAGDQVVCPLHQSVFEVRTGAVQNSPATEDLRSFPVKVSGATVYLELEG